MSRLRTIAPVLFPVFLLGVAWACVTLTKTDSAVAGLWPVNALALAFMMRWGRTRQERAYVLVMALAVMLAGNIMARNPPLQAVGMASIGTLEIALSAYILRFCSDPLASLKCFAIFVGGAVISAPIIGGALAALLFAFPLGGASFQPAIDPIRVFIIWSSANGLGMVIFGSLLLSVGRPTGVRDKRAWLWFALAQMGVLVASAVILIGPKTPPLFLLFPFMAGAALSHRQLGGVTAVAIVSVVATYSALIGRGTTAVAELAGLEPALVMQVLLAALVFTVLPVSALLRRLDVYAAELEQRRAEAEELSAVKTRLLAHVSHEIRSPLAGVTTLAQLLRDGAMGELTAAQRETLAEIAASGADVAALARDLTDAASLQSGKATVHLSQVHVGEAIKSAANVARFRAAQYQARIELRGGGAEDLYVVADPLRLRQILVNLLINGAKYGGRPPVVRISANARDGMIRFEVSDNGAGVDPERHGLLFQDFERLGAEKSDLDGAGLGLALSQQIARLQNGVLSVEDGELGGACFWLELPAAQAKASAA